MGSVSLTKFANGDLLVLIEYLHPHKRIEDGALESVMLTRGIVGENTCTSKVEYEGYNELINRLSNDHFPHGYCD